MRPSAPSAASATMEMALVQTILGPGWNRRFNCADDADDTDAKEPNQSGLWIRDCVYRACYCLPDFGRWHTESAGRFAEPAARFYPKQSSPNTSRSGLPRILRVHTRL